MPEFIEIERHGPVTRVWLNRPRIHNAIHAAMIAEATEAFAAADSDPAVRVVVLGARGKSFCVGADLNWMVEKGESSAQENREDARRLAAMLRAIYECRKPTVARVHGLTMGGGNGMVAACDLAVAAEQARFRVSETKLGIVPAVISPYLYRKLGDRHCREIFLTAAEFDAEKASAFGLVQRVVGLSELDAAVDDWVQGILQNGPQALLEAKKLLGAVPGMNLDEASEYTADLIARLRSSPEGQEGMKAFFEKRDPDWVVDLGVS